MQFPSLYTINEHLRPALQALEEERRALLQQLAQHFYKQMELLTYLSTMPSPLLR